MINILWIKTVSIYIGIVNENRARMYTITHAQLNNLNSNKIATTNIIRSSREGTFAYTFTSPQTRLHSHSFLREGARVILKVSKIRREFSYTCVPSRIDRNWLKCTRKLWDCDTIALDHIGFTEIWKFLSMRVKIVNV